MKNEAFSEVFIKVAELAAARGEVPINRSPGCWEITLGSAPDIRIAVNGHKAICKDSSGMDVPPFTAYAEWNGWPFALIGPYGGNLLQSPMRRAGSAERLLTIRLARAIREAKEVGR